MVMEMASQSQIKKNFVTRVVAVNYGFLQKGMKNFHFPVSLFFCSDYCFFVVVVVHFEKEKQHLPHLPHLLINQKSGGKGEKLLGR